MSGERLTPEGEPAGEGRRAYRFRMDASGRALSDRDRGRRHRLPRARARAPASGPSRPCSSAAAAELRRHRADGRGGGAALRALSLGALRRDRAAAELPLWRHGESDPHLPDADLHRRRPEPGRPGRARAGPQLVGQSRHQRGLVGQLAERGLHLLFREPDHGGALRAGRGRRRRQALSWADMESAFAEHGRTAPATRLHAERRSRRRASAASSTTRARPSCGRSSGSSGGSGSTPICAPISTATPSSR